MGATRRVLLALLVLAAAPVLAAVARGEGRIALVIGNSAYATSPLANPVRDARLMAAALEAQGFRVMARFDVGQTEMKLAITEFGRALEGAGAEAVGLFYYAGHGVQVGGENYLIPIDAAIENEAHVDIYAVGASAVLGTLAYARNRLNIVILDACRNNPFARSFRSPVRGLAVMNAPTGTLIAYSTAPGEVALDGDAGNSPYTAALAAGMREPGVAIEQMFKQVRDRVLAATGGRQTPWEASSLTGPDFFLVPAAAVAVAPEPEPEPRPAQGGQSVALELAFWDTIRDSADAADFEDYLARFPAGAFVGIAKRRLAELGEQIAPPRDDKEEVAVVVPPRPGGNELRVDGGGGGDHRTIQAAIDAARPGTTILVHPGIYRESISIDKRVAVVGRGDRDRVIIEVGGATAVAFSAGDGRIANLTVRAGDDREGNGVFINGGAPTIEGLDISGFDWPLVFIRDGANPHLRGNHIHDGGGNGVRVTAKGRGTLEDNDIFATAMAAVSIDSGGEPVLRNNRIHGSDQVGIFVYDGGLGTFEKNELYGHAHACLQIKSAADPVIRGNQIHDCAGGIYVNDSGLGTIVDNTIFNNSLPGITIRGGGNPIVRGNRIYDGEQAGIHVYEGGLGTIEENDIHGNAHAGVQIKAGADPVLRRNRIYDGLDAGIYVLEEARGLIEDNDIWGNAFSGISIESGADPMVRGNRIHDGLQSGVYVLEDGRGTIEDNDIYGNGFAGVSTRSGGNPIVIGNRIATNGYQGVWIEEGGRGRFENNDLRRNERGPWFLEAGAGSVERLNNTE